MRPTHLARGIACAAALAVIAARPVHAQRDTLETGPGTFGLPVVASVQVGDLMPLHGVVHVAWTRDAALRHAWKDFGPWQQEPVADSALSYDIAVKGDGLATIAVADGSGRLIFAEREPGGWVRDTVLTVPGVTLRVSVAPYGEPAFVWIQFAAGSNSARLRHARRTGGSWTITDVADSLATTAPSFAIASGPRPLIAALRFDGDLLGNAVLFEGAGPDGPFTSAFADTTCIGPIALAWDPSRARPFMVFGARRPGDIDLYRDYKVAWRDAASTWHSQEVGTPESGFISAVSIALDPVGAVGALWARQGVLEDPGGHSPGTCPSNTVPHFSRQPAGVPSVPFDPAVPLVPPDGIDAIFGNRAVTSHHNGTFDFVWREPRSTCAPFAIVYQELELATTDVAGPGVPTLARLDLWPTPRRAGETVRVRWSQPRAADVRLVAHDLAGRVVMSFAPGRLPAGEHEHAWNAGRLAPGLYWLSLRLDGESVAGRTLVSR